MSCEGGMLQRESTRESLQHHTHTHTQTTHPHTHTDHTPTHTDKYTHAHPPTHPHPHHTHTSSWLVGHLRCKDLSAAHATQAPTCIVQEAFLHVQFTLKGETHTSPSLQWERKWWVTRDRQEGDAIRRTICVCMCVHTCEGVRVCSQQQQDST